MFNLSTELDFYNDLLDVLKLFVRYYHGEAVSASARSADEFSCTVSVAERVYSFEKQVPTTDEKRQYKRFIKLSLYRALSDYYNTELPWGSLTGIRPTKLAYERLKVSGDYDGVAKYLIDEFCVSARKAEIVKRILHSQKSYVANLSGKVNLYVHIPFCDSRCSYCSFPSADIRKHGGLLDDYVNALVREIICIKSLIAEQHKEILSVYVGGGTPSVLSAEQIGRLMNAIDCASGREFTFETGRPDSVTTEKLDTLKKGGVTRICVNPQSLNDKTLATIGRNHTAQDFFRAFDLVKRAGFSVNTDIIAGLPNETFDDFALTLNGVVGLSPDNLTVHTLSRKRGSPLADAEIDCGEAERMMEYAYDRTEAYSPYYLYRQKYMSGNLENVGFCLPDKECVNNITVMEELLPVYACGAGSISKNVADGDITRHASPKDVSLYLSQFEDRLARKLEFFRAAQA